MLRVILLGVCLFALAFVAEAKTKRAFIVGVGDYAELTDLKKTIGDADGYTNVFQDDLGFEVTRLSDPTLIEFLEAFDGFLRAIEPGDDIAFIFSGHGWSDGSDNYLALKDAPLEASEFALRRQTASLANDILAELKARQPGLLFAIIDACRDNPFDTGTRSVTKGLVRVEAVPGTLILYAAGARQKALDRLGPEDDSPYSVFTRSLLPQLQDPHRPLMRSVEDTRNEVETLAGTINHSQRPASYSDVSLDYCFAGANCAIGGEPLDPETEDWLFISSEGYGGVDKCTKYAVHLETYPDGQYAEVARSFLAQPACASRRTRFAGAQWLADLNGHEDAVYGVDYSASGRFVAGASRDNNAYLWVVGMGLNLFGNMTKFEGHTGPVLTVRFGPLEERIVTASEDNTARIWRSIGGEAQIVLDGHEHWVSYAEFSPFGTHVVTGSFDTSIRVWDAFTGEEVRRIDGHEGAVRSVRYSPDGSQLVSASNDGSVKVWNADTGELVRIVEETGFSPATYATFSPDGSKILVASQDKTARIWSEGAEPITLTGHDKSLWNAAFSADGELIATSAADFSGLIWDAVTGAEIGFVQSIGDGGANWVEFSPDGTKILASMAAGPVQLWELTFTDTAPVE